MGEGLGFGVGEGWFMMGCLLVFGLEVFYDSLFLWYFLAEMVDFICEELQFHLVSFEVAHGLADCQFEVVVLAL